MFCYRDIFMVFRYDLRIRILESVLFENLFRLKYHVLHKSLVIFSQIGKSASLYTKAFLAIHGRYLLHRTLPKISNFHESLSGFD